MERLKVALAHPRLGSGGSEARVLWGIQALREIYDVTLITTGKVDLQRLNQYYGTRLDPEDFSLQEVRMPFNLPVGARFAAVTRAIFQRHLQRVSTHFDVMMSAYNPYDFGVEGIQFIGDFGFVNEWRQRLHPTIHGYRRWWYGDSPLRRAYLALCNRISKPPNLQTWKRDMTVANSDWSAGLLRKEFGIEARTLYPPVAGDFPAVRWEDRDDGFVCIGRVVPEKRMDAIVGMLARVREKGHKVHLHILGHLDGSPYARKLKGLADQHQDWVFLEGLMFGEPKKALLSHHRYAINACINEAFGIAVAEAVKAGCIAFVPDGGGQTEIVNHPALIYTSDDDAVNKIDVILRSRQMQDDLVAHLHAGAERFSTRSFSEGLLAITREFLARKNAGNLMAETHAKP